MMHLTPPSEQYLEILDEVLSCRLRRHKAVAIRSRKDAIVSKGKQYVRACGNPWSTPPIGVTGLDHGHLKSMYPPPANARICTNFINFIKHDRSPDICPMCGSNHTGTVEHLFPRDDWPELSLLPQNCVPACSNCNSKRNTRTKGHSSPARVLHPYYDAFASGPIIYFTFSFPDTEPEPSVNTINVTGDLKAIVECHIEYVLIPSGALKWGLTRIARIGRDPQKALLIEGPVTEASVIAHAQKLELHSIKSSGSSNSLEAALYRGITYSSAIVTYLVEQQQKSAEDRVAE